MQANYGGCGSDAGWFVAVERISSGCGWELRSSSRPYFLYSDAAGSELEDSKSYYWNKNMNFKHRRH